MGLEVYLSSKPRASRPKGVAAPPPVFRGTRGTNGPVCGDTRLPRETTPTLQCRTRVVRGKDPRVGKEEWTQLEGSADRTVQTDPTTFVGRETYKDDERYKDDTDRERVRHVGGP